MHLFTVLPKLSSQPTPLADLASAIIPKFTFSHWSTTFVRRWGWSPDFATEYTTVINDLTPTAALRQQDRNITAELLTRRVFEPNLYQSQPWYILLRIAVDSYMRSQQWRATGKYPNGYKLEGFEEQFSLHYRKAMALRHRPRIISHVNALIQQWASVVRSWNETERKPTEAERELAALDFSGLEARVIGLSTPHSEGGVFEEWFKKYAIVDHNLANTINDIFVKDSTMSNLFGNSATNSTASRSEADFDAAYEKAKPGTWVGPVVIGYDEGTGSPVYSERVFKPNIVTGDELVLGTTYVLQTLGDGYAPDFVQPGIRVVPLDNGEGFVGEVLLADGTYRVFVTDGTDQYTLA